MFVSLQSLVQVLVLLHSMMVFNLLMFLQADCHKLHQGQLCKSTCPGKRIYMLNKYVFAILPYIIMDIPHTYLNGHIP